MHPKYGWNGTVSRVFPLIALIDLGAFFHSTPGSAYTLVIEMIACNYFCFRANKSDDYSYNYNSSYYLAELILKKCNSSWEKPSDYNYTSEFQEELLCKKIH